MNTIRAAQRQAAHDTIVAALKKANGRVGDAAKLCGVSRTALDNWIRRLGIDHHSFRIK